MNEMLEMFFLEQTTSWIIDFCSTFKRILKSLFARDMITYSLFCLFSYYKSSNNRALMKHAASMLNSVKFSLKAVVRVAKT